MQYIIKPTDGITPARVLFFAFLELIAVAGIVLAALSGNTLLIALNIATVFVGFNLLPAPLAGYRNKFDTSLVDILGALANWAYYALAVPVAVVLLKSPYDPAVLYWPALIILLAIGLGTTLEKARHKAMDGRRALREAVHKSVETIPVDPLNAMSMDAYDKAYEETKRIRDSLYERWEAVKLPTPRKLTLISHQVAPEAATSPEVLSMSDEDLAAYKGLHGLSEGLQKVA